MKIAFVFGTRPEAIKLAPVISGFKKVKKISPVIVSTGQHDRLLKDALSAFRIRADVNFSIMKPKQTLSSIMSASVVKVEKYLKAIKPVLTVVQGDSSSAFAGALASFYNKIPLVHIEAGCRSHNLSEPFPEEANRRLIAGITSWHFPATRKAEENLLSEGYDKKRIFQVGSTEVDAIRWIIANTSFQTLQNIIPTIRTRKNIVVITTHRRESWGDPLSRVFNAIKTIATRYPTVFFVYSIHPNPLVLHPAMKILSKVRNLNIIPHIATVPFVHLMRHASLIMTDSGGVQLQAGALLKPVIILRNVTEWPELIEYGIGQLVGTDREAIISTFEEHIAKKWPKKIPRKPIYRSGAADKIIQTMTSKILL